MKKKYGKQKKVRTFVVGESVSVKVPWIDRTSTDVSRIPCVVVEIVGKARDLYRLRCGSGVLKSCCNAGDLESFSGKFNIPVDGWQDQPQVTLRQASMEQSARNVFTRNHCHCQSCDNRRCGCRKAEVACSTHCHNGKVCNNKHPFHEEENKDGQQDKKEECQQKNETGHKNRSCTGATEPKMNKVMDASVEKDATARSLVHASQRVRSAVEDVIRSITAQMSAAWQVPL